MTEEFINCFNENIKRDGAQKLLEWLKQSDFFVAPASSKFHLNHEGGLCEHSINVYKRLLVLLENEFGDNLEKFYSKETAAICGLLHDVCKVNYYQVEYRNQKIDDKWEKVPYYKIDEELPYGHGEKSVYIISAYIHLTREEAVAINWHMGGFDARVKGGSSSLSEAFDKFHLATLLHIADMQATYLEENTKLKALKESK